MQDSEIRQKMFTAREFVSVYDLIQFLGKNPQKHGIVVQGTMPIYTILSIVNQEIQSVMFHIDKQIGKYVYMFKNGSSLNVVANNPNYLCGQQPDGFVVCNL